MAVYQKIYKKLGEATDEKSGFYDFEVFKLVKQEAQIIGRENIENRFEHNWTLAKSNLASQIELVLIKPDEFRKSGGEPEYQKYFRLANRLLQQDSQEPALV